MSLRYTVVVFLIIFPVIDLVLKLCINYIPFSNNIIPLFSVLIATDVVTFYFVKKNVRSYSRNELYWISILSAIIIMLYKGTFLFGSVAGSSPIEFKYEMLEYGIIIFTLLFAILSFLLYWIYFLFGWLIFRRLKID